MTLAGEMCPRCSSNSIVWELRPKAGYVQQLCQSCGTWLFDGENQDISRLPVVRILEETAKAWHEQTLDAETALNSEKPGAYTEALCTRAQLLIELPDKIRQHLWSLSREKQLHVWEEVTYWRASAQRYVSERKGFCLGVLLIDRGDKIGDPNQLERLINEIQQPQ